VKDADGKIAQIQQWRDEAFAVSAAPFTRLEDESKYTRDVAGMKRTLAQAKVATLDQVLQLLHS
jgi:hypothetical protein